MRSRASAENTKAEDCERIFVRQGNMNIHMRKGHNYKTSRREKDNKSEERKHDRSKRLKKTSNRRSTGRR